jgi:putative endonuclease
MDLLKIVGTARQSICARWPWMGLVRFIGDRFYPWDQLPCPAWKNSRQAGSHGERVAARYLQRAGVKILVRNYQARCGEIDLVGRHGQELVVVEVKTRHFLARLKPEHAVTYGKQRRIIATANRYLRELPSRPPPVRFDIVEILYSPGQIPSCRWLQHAFTLQEAGLEWSR